MLYRPQADVEAGSSKKLSRPWKGPYRIISRLDDHDLRFRVQSSHNADDIQDVSVQRLKIFCGRPFYLSEPTIDSAAEPNVHEVESILNHQTKGNTTFYLIKWKGYTKRDNTWEPEHNILAKELLDRYWNRTRSTPSAPPDRQRISAPSARPQRQHRPPARLIAEGEV